MVRDLSGVLADITALTLTPRGLQRLRTIDPATLPVVAQTPAASRRRGAGMRQVHLPSA